jgi:hypothetical protein
MGRSVPLCDAEARETATWYRSKAWKAPACQHRLHVDSSMPQPPALATITHMMCPERALTSSRTRAKI